MKTEERHTYLELCIPYVFGRLNPGNRKQFEAHLATGCEPCTKELAELHEAMGLMPLLLKQQAPSANVRERLLRRVSGAKPEAPPTSRKTVEVTEKEKVSAEPKRPRTWVSYVLVVFSAFILIAGALFINDLIGTIGGQERKVVELQGELQRKDDILAVLRSEQLEIAQLSGLGLSPAAHGKVLWDSMKRTAVVYVANIPLTPANKEYQVWILKNGKMTSVGTFSVMDEREKESVFRVMALPTGERQEIDGFSVTLEPKGGSSQPTGALYLRGLAR